MNAGYYDRTSECHATRGISEGDSTDRFVRTETGSRLGIQSYRVAPTGAPATVTLKDTFRLKFIRGWKLVRFAVPYPCGAACICLTVSNVLLIRGRVICTNGGHLKWCNECYQQVHCEQ